MTSLIVWLCLAPAYVYMASKTGQALARNDRTAATPAPRRTRYYAGDTPPSVRDEMAELQAWEDAFPGCPECQPIRRGK